MRIRTEAGAEVLEAGGESFTALSPGVFEVPDAIGQALVRFPSYSEVEETEETEPAVVEAEPEAEQPEEKPKPRRSSKPKAKADDAEAETEEDD